MQGQFQHPLQKLEAPWEQANFLPMTETILPPANAAATAAAAAATAPDPPDHVVKTCIIQPPQSFRIGKNVYFIMTNDASDPVKIRDFLQKQKPEITTYLETNKYLTVGVWKVPYKATVKRSEYGYQHYLADFEYQKIKKNNVGTMVTTQIQNEARANAAKKLVIEKYLQNKKTEIDALHITQSEKNDRYNNLKDALNMASKNSYDYVYEPAQKEPIIQPDDIIVQNEEAQCILTIPYGEYNKENIHRCNDIQWEMRPEETFYMVGKLWIMERIMQAERADFEFASRIQGLQGSTQDSVWTCIKASPQMANRNEFVDRFVHPYIQKFVQNHPARQGTDPDQVIMEAIRMYQKFCDTWELKHIKQVSCKIHAYCESLIVIFKDQIASIYRKIPLKQLVFLIRRDPELSPHFTLCLHYYITKLEQDKGTRNASYKSMNNAYMSNLNAINAMNTFFQENTKKILGIIEKIDKESQKNFAWEIIDWADIVNQFSFHEPKFTGWRNSRMAAYGDGGDSAGVANPLAFFQQSSLLGPPPPIPNGGRGAGAGVGMRRAASTSPGGGRGRNVRQHT